MHRCPPAATLEAREDTFGEVSDFGVVLAKSALESRRGGVQFGTPGIDSPEAGLPRVHSPPRRVSLLPGNRPGWGFAFEPRLASSSWSRRPHLSKPAAIATCPPWLLGGSAVSRLLRVWHSPDGRVNTVQQPPRDTRPSPQPQLWAERYSAPCAARKTRSHMGCDTLGLAAKGAVSRLEKRRLRVRAVWDDGCGKPHSGHPKSFSEMSPSTPHFIQRQPRTTLACALTRCATWRTRGA